MGADNTFGEVNFNPKPKTKEEKLADAIISDMVDAGMEPEQMIEVIKLARSKYEALKWRRKLS